MIWNSRLCYFSLVFWTYYCLCASVVADNWTPIGLIVVPLKVVYFSSHFCLLFFCVLWFHYSVVVVTLSLFSLGFDELFHSEDLYLQFWRNLYIIPFLLSVVSFSQLTIYHMLELFILFLAQFPFHIFNFLWYILDDFLRSIFQFTKFLFFCDSCGF